MAGCILTGNEDGIKQRAMNILYVLQHIAHTVPPQADAGWIGEAGPGPSYLDEDSGGQESEFTLVRSVLRRLAGEVRSHGEELP